MANTSVANGSSLNPIHVQEKVIGHYAERQNLFADLIGTGPDSIIQKITELEKGKGDTVKVHIFGKLATYGVTGDSTLEGNEEALAPYNDSIKIDQLRHAVKLDGKMTEQRSAVNLRLEAGVQLGTYARDLMTEFLTFHLSGARGVRTGHICSTGWTGFANSLVTPDSAHQLIAGAGTKAGLTSSDKMTTALLDKSVAKIKLLMNAGVPMRPATVKGRKYFVCYVTPEQMYDLRQDTNWINAQKDANVRSEDNPIFSGAEGMWNGLVIKVNDAGVLFNDYGAGSNVGAARAVILGAQAAAVAFGNSGSDAGNTFKYIEKVDFDYFNQNGFAIASIFGVKKLAFNSKDNGVFTVDTAYTSL
jgi:N4-gp56 family major capsid protein